MNLLFEDNDKRVSARLFAQFCAAPASQHEGLIKQMMGDLLRDSGPSYWTPVINHYRGWLGGEFATKGDCIRAFQDVLGKNARSDRLRTLLAGDRVGGGELVSVRGRSWRSSGFKINATPELAIRHSGSLWLLRFWFNSEGDSAASFGGYVANVMRAAYAVESGHGAIIGYVDVESGQMHRPSGTPDQALPVLRGHADLLRAKWDLVAGTAVA